MEQVGGKPRLRVLIVARPPVARAGLRGLLAEVPGVSVVGAARSLDDVGERLAEGEVDVVLGSWDGGNLDLAVALVELLATEGRPLVLLGDAPAPADLGALVRVGLRGF